jgi:hypothetical protein
MAKKTISEQTIKELHKYDEYQDFRTPVEKDGYNAPSNGEDYILLLIDVTNQARIDVDKLAARSFTSEPNIIRAFEDLISQKILLERFGSTSWFITAAMQ